MNILEKRYCFYELWSADTRLNIESLKVLKKLALERKPKFIITSHSGLTTNIELAFSKIDSTMD